MVNRIRVYGIVQGVGFRPTVARHASEYRIRGTVSNKGPYVEIFAEADGEDAGSRLAAFADAIEHRSPKRAVILRIDVKTLGNAGDPPRFQSFQIIESIKTKGEILISPDIAICDDCREELYEPGNRRYLHPFINCTCCGPRLTILDALPYDRIRTSMKDFPMCPECDTEYHEKDDRRFDAQPVCCNNCGPVVYLLKYKDNPDDGIRRYEDLAFHPETDREVLRADQHDAISHIRKTIAEGGIAAIKGIGGYHLCCDAGNEEAVHLLRTRKTRPMKPFAVMMRDMDTVAKNCYVTKEQEEILTGHQKPIILLKKRERGGLAESVAPDNPKAGVMLPYAPVQMLLFDYDDGIRMPDALVMTSANTSGAPICRDEQDAIRELSHLADEILAHNRMIRIRADDTVMDFYENAPYMIRRSRGYAPLPVVADQMMPEGGRVPYSVIAIGGELKNSFCLRVGSLCYMSPYIGDMEDIRTVDALKETIERFRTLLEAEPEAVICDMHPRYNTTEAARMLGLPVYKIQHHYAHVLSCMAENNYNGKVIGVSYDGTGYGTDGTIWGGEILLSDTKDFVRSASIMPFLQVGGDRSAKEGWRIAVSMLYGLHLRDDPDTALERTVSDAAGLQLCSEEEARVVAMMSDRSINAVRSTSAGRLFDAVSAVLGIRRASTFEGEASTSLQFAAERYLQARAEDGKEGYPDEGTGDLLDERAVERPKWMPYREVTESGAMLLMPTDRLVSEIRRRRLSGESAGALALYFHRALAEMTVNCCDMIRRETGESAAALTGGCYQNTLLLSLTEKGLKEKGFRVLRHGMIPPNDGGIALGQAIWTGGF